MGHSSDENALDFVPRLSFLPIEWRSIGSAFGLPDQKGAAASGRCSFVVRQGVDPLEGATTGRVMQGLADIGAGLKLSTLALVVSASNLRFRSGLDDPTAAMAQRASGEGSVPSLKLTAAKQFKGENYVAASYDLKQRKPELSACWTGEAGAERATLLIRADPVMRSVKLAAAVRTPGPEWRKVLYNDETDMLEYPQDDGARHTLYVTHEARGRDLLHATRLGCRLDVGRLVNYACEVMDVHVDDRIPGAVWNVPGLGQLWNLLIPPEDDDQVRHHIRNWELDVSHDFARTGVRPTLALCKSFPYGSLTASYDTAEAEAGVSYSRRGLTLGARVARLEGAGWKKPSLHLSVEPLNLLLGGGGGGGKRAVAAAAVEEDEAAPEGGSADEQ